MGGGEGGMHYFVQCSPIAKGENTGDDTVKTLTPASHKANQVSRYMYNTH